MGNHWLKLRLVITWLMQLFSCLFLVRSEFDFSLVNWYFLASSIFWKPVTWIRGISCYVTKHTFLWPQREFPVNIGVRGQILHLTCLQLGKSRGDIGAFYFNKRTRTKRSMSSFGSNNFNAVEIFEIVAFSVSKVFILM